MSSVNKYVFDTNSLSNVFKHYYHDRFPTFWKRFNNLVDEMHLISVREVKKEIEVLDSNAHIQKWIKEHPDFFPIPTNDELKFITEIYKVNHFQHNLEKKKLLHGGAFADPFVIASAKVNNALVVTQEKFKQNGTKIPNLCKHFKIEWTNLEGFLKKENWTF